jgi:uncharacterized protein YjiK
MEARIIETVPLVLPASGITHLATGETIFVHDKRGVFLFRAGRKPERLAKRKGLEGITTDPGGKHVWVHCENKRAIERYDVERSSDGKISLIESGETRRLPKLKGKKNAGWKGLTFLPAESGGRDHLVCAHERKPRRLGIYSLPDLDDGLNVALPKEAKSQLDDISGVAFEASSGHLFLVSDRSRTLVELAMIRKAGQVELVPLSRVELDLKPTRKPEGLAFDAAGRLWVSLDYEKRDDARRGVALVIEFV